MNPETNKFEKLAEKLEWEKDLEKRLVRPNGEPVPKHWSVFAVSETVVIKNYTFRVAYIGESNILFEPVGQILVGENKNE